MSFCHEKVGVISVSVYCLCMMLNRHSNMLGVILFSSRWGHWSNHAWQNSAQRQCGQGTGLRVGRPGSCVTWGQKASTVLYVTKTQELGSALSSELISAISSGLPWRPATLPTEMNTGYEFDTQETKPGLLYGHPLSLTGHVFSGSLHPYPQTKEALGPSFCSLVEDMKYLVGHPCPPSSTILIPTETFGLPSEMYQFSSLMLECGPVGKFLRGLELLPNRRNCVVKITDDIWYQCEEESVFYK